MPILPNARHEAFAQARALGASTEDAYEDAGFTSGHGHASRLAVRPEVAERIAELRALQTEMEGARTPTVIAALLRVAKASEDARTPAALKEIRLTLLEVDRPHARMEKDRLVQRVSAWKGI